MAVQLNSPGWRIQTASRGAPGADTNLKTLPDYFLTPQSRVSDELVLEPAARTRGQDATAETIDLACDVEPGQVAVLAIRHPSGALTFHVPVQSTSRGLRGPSLARFQVAVRRRVQTRGVIAQAVKAIVIKAAQLGGDKLVSLVLPKLVETLEKRQIGRAHV